jgi:hypothetical protein
MPKMSISHLFQRPDPGLESQYIAQCVLKDNLSYGYAITGIVVDSGTDDVSFQLDYTLYQLPRQRRSRVEHVTRKLNLGLRYWQRSSSAKWYPGRCRARHIVYFKNIKGEVPCYATWS